MQRECHVRRTYVIRRIGKRVVLGKNRHQGSCTKDVVVGKADTTKKRIRISTCAIQNNVAKVKSKHLVFKTSIAGIYTCLLIDNSSEAKLIDKSFAHSNKISTFQLEKPIQLTLGNGKVVQRLTKGCLVDIEIGDHKDQILCYLAKLDVYTVIFGDSWLQIHNPAIDWKDHTMKFNSADCMEKDCLLYSKPCIKFAVGCKLKHEIGSNKPTAVSDVDIQQVSAKHFFWMAQKKDHEGYFWIPRVASMTA